MDSTEQELQAAIKQGKETRRKAGKFFRWTLAIIIGGFYFGKTLTVVEITQSAAPLLLSAGWVFLGMFIANESRR